MTRLHIPALLAIAVATSPQSALSAQSMVATTQLWTQLPVPPTPPAQVPHTSFAPGQFQPAPVPNPDLLPPQGSAQSGPQFTPGLFMPKDRFAGDGYIPGTTVQSEQERRQKPGAGFNLNVPLD